MRYLFGMQHLYDIRTTRARYVYSIGTVRVRYLYGMCHYPTRMDVFLFNKHVFSLHKTTFLFYLFHIELQARSHGRHRTTKHFTQQRQENVLLLQCMKFNQAKGLASSRSRSLQHSYPMVFPCLSSHSRRRAKFLVHHLKIFTRWP